MYASSVKKGMGYHADALSQFEKLFAMDEAIILFHLGAIVDQSLKSFYMQRWGDFISIPSNRNLTKMLMWDLGWILWPD